MVSTRSWTWAAVLFQLVLSCSALIASMAIVSAQMQSTDRYGTPQKPSLEVIIVCFLSFGLMFSTILAMFGLSNHHSSMLLPLILISLVICVFHATTTARLVMDCWPDKLLPPDSDTLFSEITAMHCPAGGCRLPWIHLLWTMSIALNDPTAAHTTTLPSIRYQFGERSQMDYQVVLAGEMVLLIAGETGVAMLHGWTEGVGYAMRPFYTPMWTCAVLMILVFALILSLFFVFVGLHFNRPSIIKHHVIALYAAWPLALCVIVGGIITGAPFLVGFVLFLYFSSLLPFAYIYGNAEWKAAESSH